MAAEFSDFLNKTREAPLREKVDGLIEIIKNTMMQIMSIPDNVDRRFASINEKITNIDKKINDLEVKMTNLKVAPAAPLVENPSVPVSSSRTPPPGQPSRPTSSRPLRGTINDELKELFRKRGKVD